jgi:hypothetical protein
VYYGSVVVKRKYGAVLVVDGVIAADGCVPVSEKYAPMPAVMKPACGVAAKW